MRTVSASPHRDNAWALDATGTRAARSGWPTSDRADRVRSEVSGTLQPLADSAGVISNLALDHLDAMRNTYRRAGVASPSETAMLETKIRIVEALGQSASSIMLDPAAVARCRPGHAGLVLPLEAQGYESVAGGRLTRLTRDFGPGEAEALGADACKLLLYYRASHTTASRQRGLAAVVAASSHEHDLPLIVEPLVYRLEDESETEYRRRFPDLVAAAANDLSESGADLLKLQFPGDLESCHRLSEAAAPLHWTVLGGSDVSGEEFAGQLELACRAGASGFIAGRPIWSGAAGLPGDEQRVWLRTEALPLFLRLAEIATEYGRRIR